MKTIKINNENYKISKKEILNALSNDKRYPAGCFSSDAVLKVVLVRQCQYCNWPEIESFNKKEKTDFIYTNIEKSIWGFEQLFATWF